MRGWLIDTNVVSELRRSRPSQRVRAFVAGQPGDVLFTSDVTFAEVRFGIERMADAARRADLVHWLDRTLRPLFAGRVLSVTEDALLRWRLMLEAGRATGHTFQNLISSSRHWPRWPGISWSAATRANLSPPECPCSIRGTGRSMPEIGS